MDAVAGVGAMSAEHAHLFDDVANAVVRVEPRAHDREPFDHYVVNRVKLASLTIHCIESDPVTVFRRGEDILADRVFDVLVHVQLEGQAQITQGDQTFTLGGNAIAIVPGGIPYQVDYPEKGRKIILRIPHRVFHERVMGREACEFGASLLGGGGLVPVIIDLIKSMTLGREGELTDIEQFTVADSFLALMGAVLRSRCGNQKDSPRSHSARLCRILAYLEESFSDHSLTPTKIASANFVSVRHLHGLFRECGTSVTKWIWDRRLRAGREDLVDPAMNALTISEIAYRRGFNDSAHFSRAFKTRFGIPPGQLRNKAQHGHDQEIDATETD